jgi:hypothetical protein
MLHHQQYMFQWWTRPKNERMQMTTSAKTIPADFLNHPRNGKWYQRTAISKSHLPEFHKNSIFCHQTLF